VNGAACSCTVRWPLLVLLFIAAPAYGEDGAITFLERKVQNDPDDFIAQNQLVARYLDSLRVTGDNEYLAKARRAAEASVALGTPEMNKGGLAVLAQVQFASHQFAAARDTARKLGDLEAGKPLPIGLLGDALLELGDYDEAARSYQELARIDPNSMDTESRLAKLTRIRGDLDGTRNHLNRALKAARGLTPRIPSVEAWCLVQLGQLAFSRGDWKEAEKEYQAALSLLPDFWSATEHTAELRGAQEKYPEAIASYENLIARVPRPELMQALGDLYAFEGKLKEANQWHERAAAAYFKDVEKGSVIYVHHLAGFFSDSVEVPEKSLEWARKDLEMRHSVYANDSMAWALYRGGQYAEAAAQMEKALALGTKDAHILFHAGMIATASGDPDRGKEFLRRAGEINPRYNAFHVHR
jgi:tetratricopeptide (TPR) repeat protein